MKITGYKIKEAIKAYELILADIDLVTCIVPESNDLSKRSDMIKAKNDLNETFVLIQYLKSKIHNLKKIQQKYNSLCKVDGVRTLAEAIQDATIPVQLSSILAQAVREIILSEGSREYNIQNSDPTSLHPLGKKPALKEPVIDKQELQRVIRKFKSDETKLKNLIGYGNGVEIEMDVDPELFDESSWNDFNREAVMLKALSEYDIFNGKIFFESGLVLDKQALENLISDLPNEIEETKERIF